MKRALDLQELTSSYKTVDFLIGNAIQTFKDTLESKEVVEAMMKTGNDDVRRKVHLVKRITADFQQDLSIVKESFEEATELIQKYGVDNVLSESISYVPLEKMNFPKLLRLINFSQFDHIHGDTFANTFGNHVKYDIYEALEKFESIVQDLIRAIMVGKTITTKSHGILEVFASQNKVRLLNFKDSNGEIIYSNVIATLDGAEDFSFPKTSSEINNLIDLALDTNDVDWFNELLLEKKKIIDNVL